MIDQNKRDKAATILRDLIDGKITNDQFVHDFPRSTEDAALPAILRAVWMQFSDRRVHKLTGRDAPPPELRAVLERSWMFLNTNLEFQWPSSKTRIGRGLLKLIGLRGQFLASDEKYKSHGDFEVWPFLRKSDYEANNLSSRKS